jgi:hypothetical protein
MCECECVCILCVCVHAPTSLTCSDQLGEQTVVCHVLQGTDGMPLQLASFKEGIRALCMALGRADERDEGGNDARLDELLGRGFQADLKDCQPLDGERGVGPQAGHHGSSSATAVLGREGIRRGDNSVGVGGEVGRDQRAGWRVARAQGCKGYHHRGFLRKIEKGAVGITHFTGGAMRLA